MTLAQVVAYSISFVCYVAAGFVLGRYVFPSTPKGRRRR